MDIWQFITLVAVPSGLIGAVGGCLVTYFFNKKFDVHQRTMEMRKETYSQINELLKGFYSNASTDERDEMRVNLLKYYRAVQIWGSDEVVKKFTAFLNVLKSENNKSQKEKISSYKEFIIVMRKDVLEKTNLLPDDFEILGKIN